MDSSKPRISPFADFDYNTDEDDKDSTESNESPSRKNGSLQKGLSVQFTEGVVTFVANPTNRTIDSKTRKEVQKIVDGLRRKVEDMISNSFRVPFSTSEVAKVVAFCVCKIKDINVLYNVLCSLELLAREASFNEFFQKVSFTNGTMTINTNKLTNALPEKIDIISKLISIDQSAAIAVILNNYCFKRDISYGIVIKKYPGKKFVVSYETYKKDEEPDTTRTAKVEGSDTTPTAKVGGSVSLRTFTNDGYEFKDESCDESSDDED